MRINAGGGVATFPFIARYPSLVVVISFGRDCMLEECVEEEKCIVLLSGRREVGRKRGICNQQR